MQPRYIVFLLLVLLMTASCQSVKRQSKAPQSSSDNIFMSIVNTVLGGPHDAPIFTRIMNKLGHVATVLFGSIFAYLKWFRQRKNRREKINQFIGQEKQTFALDSQKQLSIIGEKEVERIIYELNSEKTRVMALRSNNNSINFNVTIDVEQVIEESVNIYDIKMHGNDPEGKSTFTGFVSFKDKLLHICLEQTYEKNDAKKEMHPICLFQGRQVRSEERLIQGQWWIQNQRNTQGSYCGTWAFTY